MKILFINPTRLDENGSPVQYKQAFTTPLFFAVFNGLTPGNHEKIFINDIVEKIDFDQEYDIVAITVMTVQADRAYQIADIFREKGTTVILGGVHPTVLPEDAKKHADSVVVGEAENLWHAILEDYENNSLKDFYKDTSFPSLDTVPISSYENINLDIYTRNPGKKMPPLPLYATRGCPYGCKFCSVTKIFGKSYRMKPVEHVIKEIEELQKLGVTDIFLVDDNIAFKPEYSRKLFKALKKTGINWLSQISTTVLKNPDLIELAADSGCFALFVGIESINSDSLVFAQKGFNKTDEYITLFNKLNDAGIMPLYSFIFGFDTDTPEQFQATLDYLEKNKIYYPIFWLMTPLPGSELYDELKEEGRINENKTWSEFGATSVVFKPKNFTEHELTDYYWETYQKFYSYKKIIPHSINGFKKNKNSFKTFMNNLLYQSFFAFKVKGRDHPYSGGFGKKS